MHHTYHVACPFVWRDRALLMQVHTLFVARDINVFTIKIPPSRGRLGRSAAELTSIYFKQAQYAHRFCLRVLRDEAIGRGMSFSSCARACVHRESAYIPAGSS